LQSIDAFFTVALHDHDFFKQKYPQAHHVYMPSFQPYDTVKTMEGSGTYCLYHGNLSVEENEEAAFFLMEKIIASTTVPFIIAGKNPSAALVNRAKLYKHCRVVANPDAAQMETLIAAAHIHVLPTFQNTGLKLKLLHALFNGRHVLTNAEMLTGTGLESICTLAQSNNEFIEKINMLMQVPFSADAINERKKLLSQHYDNSKNAEQLIAYLQQKSL
jgi:hypothetical protein